MLFQKVNDNIQEKCTENSNRENKKYLSPSSKKKEKNYPDTYSLNIGANITCIKKKEEERLLIFLWK